MRHLLFLLMLCLIVPAFAQVKHPFTFDDLMALKRVGEPVPSPDGKWIVFSAVDVDLAANKKTSHIWIVPLGAGAPNSSALSGEVGKERILIADQIADRPRWSPDGKRFAFLSPKDGGSQVWIADFESASGNVTGVHKLTSIATEADGELWSPDGKNILFTSTVYPECNGAPDAETACNAKRLAETEKSPVKAQIFTRLLYRHWTAYKDGMRSHIFVAPVEGGTPRDLTPGDYDAPVFSLGGQDNYAFSPDGQEICYTSNHEKVEASSTNNDLWIVPVNGGAAGSVPARNITADNPASDSTPLYSPDGKYITYRAQQRPGYESDRFRLMLYDRKTGSRRDLTSVFDHWVGSVAWAPDSTTIYFSAEHKHHSLIYAVGVSSPDPSPRSLVAGYNDDVAVTRDGRTLIFTRMSMIAPVEIYKADAAGEGCPSRTGEVDRGRQDCSLNQTRAITAVNSPVLSQIDMSKLETFSFKGAHNDEVEGLLVRPPSFDAAKKYPVKFLIHGGPQGAWGDDWSYRWNPELFAANGYVVIMINFHGSTGYGQKFIDAINGDWGGAPFEDLMKGLDYAEKTYQFIDKDRECALGASYGGYMANWVLGHTDRFKCIVSHDGMFNTYSAWGTTEELWFNSWEFKGTPYSNPEVYDRWNPRNAGKNFKTPTLVIHGQKDYRLDVSEGFQLFTTLQTMGVPSKMLYFPDEGHWVLKPQNSQLWYKTVNDWVDQWTKK